MEKKDTVKEILKNNNINIDSFEEFMNSFNKENVDKTFNELIKLEYTEMVRTSIEILDKLDRIIKLEKEENDLLNLARVNDIMKDLNKALDKLINKIIGE